MSLEDVREESCSTPPERWKATEGDENDEKGGASTAKHDYYNNIPNGTKWYKHVKNLMKTNTG